MAPAAKARTRAEAEHTGDSSTEYHYLRVRREGRVGICQLHRPDALNALSTPLMRELIGALLAFDADSEVGAVVLTGDARAFAAGADIKEMAGQGPIDMLLDSGLALWDAVRAIHKPIVAAVSGHCLGGGLELAMNCDMIVASETARFGQPEINIGVIPGAGGTQRLARALGTRRAMELVLTGETFGAEEARAAGLVNRVVPVELYLEEALALATAIADKPAVAVRLAKQLIHGIEETFLSEGLQRERQAFFLLFGSVDQKEGMAAFVEKRPAQWKGR
ncbi:MAG: enoyl-CoA hydratase-related protein [Candidatus Sericytochromatia bacterium]|nr:enoyl-CoA hydratase-related protein [Candidatus Sericytochromatia bacterium]